MAEDARGGVRTGGNLLQIGAADAAGVHPNQDFARADLRNRNGLQADVVDAAIDRRLHGRGDGAAGRQLLPSWVAATCLSPVDQ